MQLAKVIRISDVFLFFALPLLISRERFVSPTNEDAERDAPDNLSEREKQELLDAIALGHRLRLSPLLSSFADSLDPLRL